jgi:hypothetical protein
VAVRDSKDPDGPVLEFTPLEWLCFLAGAKAGEFDLRQMLNAQQSGATEAARDLSGWSAEENAEWDTLHGPEAGAALRSANDRVWAIVRELRETALTEGRDPYQDPMAQRLSAALVGVDGKGFCELPHMSAEEEDARDRRHYARGGLVSAAAPIVNEPGCVFPALPSRADIERLAAEQRAANPMQTITVTTDVTDEQVADFRATLATFLKAPEPAHFTWDEVRAARMNPEAQAGYQAAAEHHHKEPQL